MHWSNANYEIIELVEAKNVKACNEVNDVPISTMSLLMRSLTMRR